MKERQQRTRKQKEREGQAARGDRRPDLLPGIYGGTGGSQPSSATH